MQDVKKMMKILWKRTRLIVLLVLALVFSLELTQTWNLLQAEGYSEITHPITSGLELHMLYKSDLNVDSDPEEIYSFPYETDEGYQAEYDAYEIMRMRLATRQAFEGDFFDRIYDTNLKAMEKYGLELKDVERYQEEIGYAGDEDDSRFALLQVVHSSWSNFGESVKKNAKGSYKLDISDHVAYHLGLVVFVLILAVVLTSAEHLTNYYEFSQTYSWKKSKSFLVKLLYGAGIIILAFLLLLAIKYGVWGQSIFKNIIMISDFKLLALSLVNLLAIFSLAMGTGVIAGNVLGHLGLMGISFLGTSLIDFNVSIIGAVFGNEDIGDSLYNFYEELSPMLQGFLQPMRALTGSSLEKYYVQLQLGFLLVALLVLLIGYLCSNHVNSSRSKLAVMIRPISIYAQLLIALTMASGIVVLFVSLISGHQLLMLLVYILGLYVSYRFIRWLFNIQIGIS